jgi:hypothetical protein
MPPAPTVPSDGTSSVKRPAEPKTPRRRYNGKPPAAPGSATSADAARRMEPKAPRQRAEVYGYILAQGVRGATRNEIKEALGIPINSVCPRVLELNDTHNVTYGVPEVAEHPTMRRNKCAVIIAAPFWAEATAHAA